MKKYIIAGLFMENLNVYTGWIFKTEEVSKDEVDIIFGYASTKKEAKSMLDGLTNIIHV